MINHSKNIVVKISTIDGNDAIIPVCVNAQAFAKIAGTETLSLRTLNLIKSLGYHVNVKTDVKSLHDIKE